MTRQERLKTEFYERAEREKEDRARAAEGGSQHHTTEDDEDTAPAPPRRWERFGNRFKEATHSLTGENPGVNKVLAEKFGSRIPSAKHVREAEERLHRRLSGERTEAERVPLAQRPDPVERPVCPIDAVPLEVVSYSASMKPAERRCPVCKRSEKSMLEKGINLEGAAEQLRRSMEAGGLKKPAKMSPVEQHVRSLIRPGSRTRERSTP
jgi:rubrerythrin